MAKNLAKPEMNGMENRREVLDDDFSDSSYDIAYNLMSMLFFDQEHISGLMQTVQRSQDPQRLLERQLDRLPFWRTTNSIKPILVLMTVWAAEGGVLDSALRKQMVFPRSRCGLNPETLVQSTLQVIQESPLANPAAEAQGQPTRQGGAPNNGSTTGQWHELH